MPRYPDSKNSPRPTRRRWWVAGLLVGLTLGAVAAQEGLPRLLAETAWPTGHAEWIWQAERHRQTGPWAFWAVRDFQWPALEPEEGGASGLAGRSEEGGPRVLVQADPSYLLYLNGRRVGSNLYRPDAPPDSYPVADLLRTGVNRLAVLVRSGSGAGGLLLALVDGDGRPRVVTDDHWRLFNRAHPGILGGWLPADTGERAISWGLPPVGRWGSPHRPSARGRFDQVTGPPWRRQIHPPRRWAVGPAMLDRAANPPDLPWRPVEPKRLQAPGEANPLGPVVLLDWGRPVTGYLNLDHSRRAGRPAGLLKVGLEPPRALGKGGTVEVISVPGAAGWRDAVPRTFRYALVLGVDSLVGAWIEPVAEESLEALPSPPPSVKGVFGVEAPPLESPIEHEVRRKLQSLADRVGREAL